MAECDLERFLLAVLTIRWSVCTDLCPVSVMNVHGHCLDGGCPTDVPQGDGGGLKTILRLCLVIVSEDGLRDPVRDELFIFLQFIYSVTN